MNDLRSRDHVLARFLQAATELLQLFGAADKVIGTHPRRQIMRTRGIGRWWSAVLKYGEDLFSVRFGLLDRGYGFLNQQHKIGTPFFFRQRRQYLQRSDFCHYRAWLSRKQPVKFRIFRLRVLQSEGGELESRVPAKDGWDVCLACKLIQKYRHAALVFFAAVQIVIDQGPL